MKKQIYCVPMLLVPWPVVVLYILDELTIYCTEQNKH